jgi:hypothetical protein
MANPGQLVPEYTILGSFGELYDENNNFLSHIQEVSAQITIDRQDIMMSGSRKIGYKYTAVRGEGTMRGFRVTSTMARLIANTMTDDRAPQYVGQITMKLRDPEIFNGQEESVRLERCKWWGVNLGWAVNQIVEEDTPFTFQNIVWEAAISATESASGGEIATAPTGFTRPNLPVIPGA